MGSAEQPPLRASKLTPCLCAVNNLSSLPSTQTRENTWRPAHARLTPVTARELTVSHLLAATAHVGHNVTHLNRAAEGLVYGTRHKVAYIDVERFTLPALKRAAKVVRDTVWRDGVVLFCGTMPGTQAAVLAAAKRLGPNGFHVTQERWMPGVLTNAPKILARATASGMDAYTAAMRERRDRTSSDDRLPSRRAREEEPDPTQLATQELQPDLLVVLNPKANLHALREATARGIATIAVTDTDVDPRICTYAIPANDESVRTAELIVGVLSKAGEEGRRQRLSDIETFKKKQARERQQRIRTQPRYAPRKVE